MSKSQSQASEISKSQSQSQASQASEMMSPSPPLQTAVTGGVGDVSAASQASQASQVDQKQIDYKLASLQKHLFGHSSPSRHRRPTRGSLTNISAYRYGSNIKMRETKLMIDHDDSHE